MYVKSRITSYGLMHADSLVCKPCTYEEIGECLQYASANNLKVCSLGSALSFSNVCLVQHQIALDITGFNKVISLDVGAGIIKVQAGIKVTEILKIILPLHYTLAGLTGSPGNTVAGNISNDVNGKDSWKNGNFSANVISIKVMLANGLQMEINRNDHADIFNAITGGLGLIAVILEVSLRLRPIASGMVKVSSVRHANLGLVLSAMQNLSPEDEFMYCWTDPHAPRHSEGRGISEAAVFVKTNPAMYDATELPGYFKPKISIAGLKKEHFWFLARRFYIPFAHQMAGYLKYYNPLRGSGAVVPFPLYQYPMIKHFPGWNLLFAPDGFREAQLLFSPEKFELAYAEILEFFKKENKTPMIMGVRRHKEQEGYLSFAGEGYSFTVNYGLKGLADERRKYLEMKLTELTLKHGGKSYIGKYPFMNLDAVRLMYPKIDHFIEVKKKMDPDAVFWSDAAGNILV